MTGEELIAAIRDIGDELSVLVEIEGEVLHVVVGVREWISEFAPGTAALILAAEAL